MTPDIEALAREAVRRELPESCRRKSSCLRMCMDFCNREESLVAAVAAIVQKAVEENAELRRLLALAYVAATKGILYGDDGELQDNRLPCIDFKRDSVEQIREKMNQRALDEIRARGSSSEPPTQASS